MTAIVILSSLCFIFFTTTALLFIGGIKASRKIENWERVFLSTHEDVVEAYDIFDKLVNRRSLLSDDPDIIRIKQVFGVVLDILGEYTRNGRELAKRSFEEKEKEKEERK